ncbi:MAG: SusD/RagB family nutrient-binding outer membrane lipoprotein [Bacteroidia bacterium]|nr:SusD/RagB family nutrient-binding outer membrane lipoprotein [Bacteroidia bacterium]
MKSFVLKTIAVTLAGMLIFMASCNFIDPDLNVDPNNPAEVEVNLLLPNTQVALSYILGGDFGRYVSIWTQHHDGIDRQHLAYSVYQIKETEVDNAWNSLYATVLSDLKIIREKAAESGSPYYAGISKTMTALTLGTLVDLFNDIPYSQALQGADDLTPAYDNAADVYAEIQSLLDGAITDFGSATSTLKPGADDLVFGGNISKWKETAQALKARYYLHLSEHDSNAYGQALAAVTGAISSNSNNAQVKYAEATTSNNPWYQFESQRGDVVMGQFFIDLMKSINDPRIAVYATTNSGGNYKGSPAGAPITPDSASRMGTLLASTSSAVPLITYAEVKFIEAEAALAAGDRARAATAHNAAIEASLAYCGVSDAAFVTAQTETEATISLEKILTHKYIALYTTQEPFVDWRRKGIPALQPASGESRIATRFPYPQSERLYNAENYKTGVTVFDKVFWDK